MKKITFFLLLCSLFFSCETEITDFKTQNLSNAYVVYGELTNLVGPYSVRINRTSSYSPYDITAFQGDAVKKAQVQILDDLGNATPLSEIRDGLYQTPAQFVAVIGKKYQLKIKTNDGIEIESSLETLKAPTPLNDFSYKFIDAEKVENMRFDVSASIKDSKENEDYYFIKRQDFIQFLTTCPEPPPPPAPVPPCFSKCWRAPLNTQPILINDFLVNGKNLPITLGSVDVKDFPDWIIQLDVYSISKETYNYWKRQEDQRVIGGGLFDKIPAQIVGNLKCTNRTGQEVLGIFQVGGVVKQRLKVDRLGALSSENLQKVQFYADFNNIRYKDLKLWDCKNAGFVDYNIGYTIPNLF
ncbi:hypothetical protein Emtol_1630 [Emticicia oligotrophica DSM 17448]|uniref:DUF4249 domain-containing protein n=1 Tax=Emticicia oligotrophica (strain DSM 17448 / CIP 109782 / MTCC 6937 / GPTSA100-15) TaxID=929562 RepID=A0ABM5N015_EMTOG|nr:DUF4249 domain-containing protein [Emticicia oligotrophica]AFK02775.1 hypothetical protein Emtol_1630 [Emticicia oligotrophica DSM 17448]